MFVTTDARQHMSITGRGGQAMSRSSIMCGNVTLRNKLLGVTTTN